MKFYPGRKIQAENRQPRLHGALRRNCTNECHETFPAGNNVSIAGPNISDYSDACPGDSGGPLIDPKTKVSSWEHEP